MCCCPCMQACSPAARLATRLLHVCESFYSLRKTFYCLVGVAMFDAVEDAVPDMSFEDDLAAAVQGGLGGVDLREDVLAGNVFIYHAVDRLDLADDLL